MLTTTLYGSAAAAAEFAPDANQDIGSCVMAIGFRGVVDGLLLKKATLALQKRDAAYLDRELQVYAPVYEDWLTQCRRDVAQKTGATNAAPVK